MDRNELLSHLRQGRQQWETLLAQVPPARISEPSLSNGWSVKDLIAHIGFWEKRIVDLYYVSHGSKDPDPGMKGLSETETNARIYARYQKVPIDQVLKDEQSAYQALLALAEDVPEADLFSAGQLDFTGKDAFANWIVWNSYEHYAEHSLDLEAWLKKQ